jgi:hypothetical protein
MLESQFPHSIAPGKNVWAPCLNHRDNRKGIIGENNRTVVVEGEIYYYDFVQIGCDNASVGSYYQQKEAFMKQKKDEYLSTSDDSSNQNQLIDSGGSSSYDARGTYRPPFCVKDGYYRMFPNRNDIMPVFLLKNIENSNLFSARLTEYCLEKLVSKHVRKQQGFRL